MTKLNAEQGQKLSIDIFNLTKKYEITRADLIGFIAGEIQYDLEQY